MPESLIFTSMVAVASLGACTSGRHTMTDLHVDPVFGPLQDDAEGYWSKSIKHGSASIEVDLNIDGDIDGVAVSRLTSRLSDLPALEARARSAMRADVKSEDSAVMLYRSHHAAELSAGALAACFGGSDAWRTDVPTFVAALHLERVGLYPDDEEQSIIMDFTLGESVTDYLLAVSFDREGHVVAVDMES